MATSLLRQTIAASLLANTSGEAFSDMEALGELLAGPAASAAALRGAPNEANGQVTASTTAASLVSTRSTRRYVTVKNVDASITVYVGAATVTSSNGFKLAAGEKENFATTAALQVIAASGSPVVCFFDIYD